MRSSLFIICLLALTTATSPTTFAAYSITNSGFDAQDGSVHLNSTLSATGWFNANNGPNTQSDTLINSQNGAQGGWDGNGFLFGNDAPFSVDGTSEQAYIYQSIGTYAGEGSITVTGYVFNRILNPILRDVGNFDAALYYTGAGTFTPAVGNDIALSGAVIGSPKVFANGVDFSITTNTTSQKAFWSHTATFAGSGIANGNEVWLRIGDGGNPTGLDWDEPVIDNLNVAPFVLGDANGDGAATLTDFTAIKNNFRLAGTSRAQGDVDTSGDVDFLDYLQWRAAFLGGGGVAADIPALFSVPEPAFGTLLALALIGICPRLRANARGQRRSSTQLVIGVVSLLVILVGSPTNVQAIDNPWNVVSGNWNTPENWLNGQVPNRAADDFPVISNGGTATLNSAAANPVGGVIIGQNAGETGVVEILPGGSLISTNTVVGTGDGIVRVGTGGTGTLRMTGGTLNTTRGIDLGQNAANILELSGNAVITSAGNFSLGGTTRVTGPSVNVTALNYNLRTTSVYVAGINSSTQFSTLKTSTPSGVVTVQGSFQADFTGVTPPVGSTWSKVSADCISDQ